MSEITGTQTDENKRVAHYDPKMLDRVLRKGFNVEKFWKDSFRRSYGKDQPREKTVTRRSTR